AQAREPAIRLPPQPLRAGMAGGVARSSMLNTGEKELVRTGDPLLFVRYLDIVVVLMAARFVVALEAPLVGYAVGAAAWIIQRFAAIAIENRAERTDDYKT